MEWHPALLLTDMARNEHFFSPCPFPLSYLSPRGVALIPTFSQREKGQTKKALVLI
jgi:hypothetical protein